MVQSRSIASSSLRSAAAAEALGVVQQVGDAAQLEQDASTRGLGGVRGEHGAHRHPAHGGGHVGSGQSGGTHPLGRAGQRASVGGPRSCHAAGAVNLLGHVRELEVRRERAGQPDGGREVGPRQVGGGLVRLVAHPEPHPLDQGEQIRAVGLEPAQTSAQQAPQPSDVGAQDGVVVGAEGVGHGGEATEAGPGRPPASGR